jgi:hypothetical protein
MTEINLPSIKQWKEDFEKMIQNPPFDCEHVIFDSFNERILFLNEEAMDADRTYLGLKDKGVVGILPLYSSYQVEK